MVIDFHIKQQRTNIRAQGRSQEPSGEEMSNLLNVEEFAEAIGLKPATIRQQVWRRQVEFVRVGRAIRFKPETVQKIIARGTVPTLHEG